MNFRVAIFWGMVLLLIGYPAYLFYDTVRSKGIWEQSDARGAYKLVDLKSMSSFEMDPAHATDADIPAHYRALNGQRVMLVGEMVLGTSAGRQEEFALVYSISDCCVTPSPKMQHFIHCKVMPGGEVNHHARQVRVIGTLHAGMQREGKVLTSVFRMDVESVEPH